MDNTINTTTPVLEKDIDYISILKNVPEFAILDPWHLKKIASLVSIQKAPAGAMIFRKNELGDAFYIVLSGLVRIFITNTENAEVTLSMVGPMDSFGEMGFITGRPRVASAKIDKDAEILVIKKNDFDVILEHDPSITRCFINVLAQRLKADNERAVFLSSREQEMKHFWVEKGARESYIISGRSKHIMELKEFGERAAENNLPVLLIGEKGTGKLAMARYIYEKSKRNNEIYLTVDCASIQQITTGQNIENQGDNELLLGISQESTLFGHLIGALPFASTSRLGYIEVAEGGTIVIENVEKLTPGVQSRLLTYLKTGYYKRLGSEGQIKSNVRLLFTCDANIEGMVKDGDFNEELYGVLKRQSILIIPLRKRKKDIHDLVDHFIKKYSEIEGKKDVRIAKEAVNILLEYHWPNNIDQVEGVIRRAVSLAEGDTLTPSHIFIGPISTEKSRGINLLKFEPVRKFFDGKFYPDIFRLASMAVYISVILILLFGFNGYNTKTVLMVWAIGWPALLISILFASRLFCGLCPMRAIAEKAQKRIHLKLRLSEFIKRYGPYIGVFGFAFILVSEQVLDMPNNPLRTAALLLSILACAMIFSVLFDRASWCRYICPFGLMTGVYSKLSMIEIRGNTSVCNSECNLPTCYKGTNEDKGCPMYLSVFNMHTNENCIMCGQCIKTCNHRSVRLNLRIPAYELFQTSAIDSYRKGSSIAIAFMIPMLIAGVMAINVRKLLKHSQLLPWIRNEIVNYTLLYMLFYFFCFGLIWFGAKCARFNLNRSSLERFVWYTCAFIPIAFAGEIANQIITFINGFGHILPFVYLHLGSYRLDIIAQQGSTEIVKFLQTMIVIIGAVASVFVGREIVKKTIQTREKNTFWHIYLLNSVFCCLFLMVFLLRE